MTAAPVPAWIVTSDAGVRAVGVPVTPCETCGLVLPADHDHHPKRAAA